MFNSKGKRIYPVRHCVLSSALDASGYSALFSNGGGLTLNLSAFSITAAIGFDAIGRQVDLFGKRSAASTFACQDGVTQYIYAEIGSGESITVGKTLLQPYYGQIAPSAPAVDQHWFDVGSFVMKRWDGAAWMAVIHVFLGHVFATGGTLVTIKSYALRGFYDSGWFAVAASAQYAKQHNIGSNAVEAELWLSSSATPNELTVIGKPCYYKSAGVFYGENMTTHYAQAIVLMTANPVYLSAIAGEAVPLSARMLIKRGF